MNKLITILFFLLVVAGIFILRQQIHVRQLSKSLEVRTIDLKRKNRELKHTLDSLDRVRQALKEREVYWQIVYMQRGDSLRQAHQVTETYRSRYEKLKKTPAPQWTSDELDSLKRAILYFNH